MKANDISWPSIFALISEAGNFDTKLGLRIRGVDDLFMAVELIREKLGVSADGKGLMDIVEECRALMLDHKAPEGTPLSGKFRGLTLEQYLEHLDLEHLGVIGNKPCERSEMISERVVRELKEAANKPCRWIEIPACRIYEVPNSEIAANFVLYAESGEMATTRSEVYRAVRKSDGKVFRVARFIPSDAAPAWYLEEI